MYEEKLNEHRRVTTEPCAGQYDVNAVKFLIAAYEPANNKHDDLGVLLPEHQEISDSNLSSILHKFCNKPLCRRGNIDEVDASVKIAYIEIRTDRRNSFSHHHFAEHIPD